MKLETVNFPEGLKEIGDQAFDGCSSLVLQDGGFPESLTTLGSTAFRNCTSLLSGELDLKNISTAGSGGYQFQNIKTITRVVAPELTAIPNGLFNNCSGLKDAVFPAGITSIGDSAFHGSALTNFYPTELSNLTSIGASAFRGLSNLNVSFDFSKSEIISVPTYALVDLAKVKVIKFPETLETLGSESLAYNKATRVVWFCGPPSTTIDANALNPNGGGSWVLVAGKKHAAKWKASENLLAFEGTEEATAKAAAESFGLTGVKPIGKWKYRTGSYTHWVVEELPKGLAIYIM